MKSKSIAALIFCAILSGCTSDSEAVRAVEAIGMKNVHTTGYRFFGCAEHDTFHTGFEATNITGGRVTGVVCSGVLKGATVRFD